MEGEREGETEDGFLISSCLDMYGNVIKHF